MPLAATRRHFIVGSVLSCAALGLAPAALRADQLDDDMDRRLAELEKKTGGRLGVSVLDTETNITIGYRETERFAMCSTFKVLASAFVLARADKGQEDLNRKVTFGKDKLVTYSPLTQNRADTEDGMTVADLCQAAITVSDNTAGNLILESFGGPEALTKWLRSIGDGSSRLDRIEPALNEAKKDDPRDTTTPDAMLDTLGNLTMGQVLTEASRNTLTDWMVASQTGGARLRAGMPETWKIGDKTGTSDTGAAGDIAIVGPEGRGPLLVTAYVAESNLPVKELNPIFAEIGKMVAEMV